MSTDSPAPSVHGMSNYEQFLFDLKGFLVIPGVLTIDEIQTIQAHLKSLARDAEGLPSTAGRRLPGRRNSSSIIQE